MAQGAASFLLQQIDYFLRREWGLPEKINTGIKSLKREIESMKALLKDADNKGEHNDQVRVWIQHVQDLAYDVEDVLDVFAFHHMAQQHTILLHTQWFTKFRARHYISNLIDDINSKLQGIKETKERYHNITSSQASSSGAGNFTYLHSRIAPLYVEDAEVVGIEEPKNMLTSWTLDGREGHKIMFVVGMGGSGKTTLVKKVYETVKEDFDCHAWINVSKSKTKLRILWTMFNKLCNPTAEPTTHQNLTVNEVDLMDRLRNNLQDKRYVIVLDDLWTKDVWESIRYALPKGTCSRIIITTRRGDIAYSCRDNSTEIHNLQPLPPEKARQLFCGKAFPQSGSCPSGLVKWSQYILEKCEGLPLGINEIGKFLSTKGETESEWKKLHDSLASELKRDGNLSTTMRVLSISYNDLPYHLKYCFLYLSLFPEYYPVNCRKLIRLWIAEGFIVRGEDTGKELEDIGEEFLKELIERSLVQPIQVDFDGRPKSCRLHNLMHKINLSLSRDKNFCTVCTESSDERTRRLSIQNNGADLLQANFPSARTLFVFGTRVTSSRSSKPNIIPSSLKLLKVLDLEGTSLDTFPREIEALLLLRYLCLRNTNISRIPRSIGNLQHLETLDLKQTHVTWLPKEILKLSKLRHLLVYRYEMVNSFVAFDSVKGFEVPSKIAKLANLQKLAFIRANKRHQGWIQGLKNLIQLRKLGIIDLPKEDGPKLCNAIQMLRNLHSLSVTSLGKNETLHLDAVSSPPPFLQRLCLIGHLERLPNWIRNLHDLVRLRLKWSRLTQINNPIEIVQDLPNLLELQLHDAYTGDQLDFGAENFQKLKILELKQLERLRMVIMENGALPCLQKLVIARCNNLLQVPVGIDKLSQLKELHMCDMPNNFVRQHESDGNFYYLITHIPRIVSN